MSEEERGKRLPPPAFPPEVRGTGARPGRAADHELTLIAPDAPWPDASGPGGTPPEGVGGLDEPFDLDEAGVVTGIGDDAHLRLELGGHEGDPALGDLVRAVSSLAESLRRKGQAGLKVTPSMSRFEATLRAYCVGYLAGRRAELSGEPE